MNVKRAYADTTSPSDCATVGRIGMFMPPDPPRPALDEASPGGRSARSNARQDQLVDVLALERHDLAHRLAQFGVLELELAQ